LLHARFPVYGHAVRDEIGDEVAVLKVQPVGTSCVRRRRTRSRTTFEVSMTADPSLVPAAHYDHVRVAHAIAWARRLARLDHAGFASALRDRLQNVGEPADDVTRDVVVSWEQGHAMPSALTLLAAADVVGVEPEVLFGRLPVIERLERLEQLLRSQAAQLDVLQQRLGHA
jgi:transcriptional regulator with XRE-family HTH domain